VPAANVLQGVTPHTVLLINSAESPETWKNGSSSLAVSFATASEWRTSPERSELPYIGAMCAEWRRHVSTGVIQRAALADAIAPRLGAHGEEIVAQNLTQAALAASDAVQAHVGSWSQSSDTTSAFLARGGTSISRSGGISSISALCG